MIRTLDVLTRSSERLHTESIFTVSTISDYIYVCAQTCTLFHHQIGLVALRQLESNLHR
jgi:hypothetical protein